MPVYAAMRRSFTKGDIALFHAPMEFVYLRRGVASGTCRRSVNTRDGCGLRRASNLKDGSNSLQSPFLRKETQAWGHAVILPRRKFLHLAAATALPSLTCIAAAQDAYPSRPIHVVIGFTPGAAADVVARVLSQAATPILGQQLVVENKPGAGSSIAAEYVAHSAKDGYTVFLATLSIITNQIINPNAALDLIRDFEPVALLEAAAIILVVNPTTNIHSVSELITFAKANPDQAFHSTIVGSMPHFASELFAQQAGIKLTQVPYQGSPQAVADVIAGRTLMTFSPASTVVGQIATGNLRALATTSNKRASALPDVPTMAESGLPNFDTSLWFGLLVPAGTPRPIVDRLAAATHEAMHAPAAIAALRPQGDDPLDAGPDEFAAFMRSEITRWTEVARAAGMKS
jgi:tripartite-type tricarboxylate transporter receptor subunit TctC